MEKDITKSKNSLVITSINNMKMITRTNQQQKEMKRVSFKVVENQSTINFIWSDLTLRGFERN